MQKTESRFGTIFKREALMAASNSFNTHALVLKSRDPYPGYYCSEKNPSDNTCKEHSIYLPVYSGSLPSEDYLCRLCLAAKERFCISSCPARFSLGGKIVKGVRLKDIEADAVDSVVKFFEEDGLKFYPETKVGTYLSHIYLKEFFDVAQIADNVYQNSINPDLYYLVISDPVEWNIFERLFTYQKSRANFKNYDAALGYWYTRPKFTEFVRIYGKNLSTDNLLEIRKEFLRNLKALNESKILI